MNELVPFLQKNEIWIYILLGFVALIPLQRLISAWKAWQGSIYGLEREIAQRRFSAALTVLLLLILFVLSEFITVSFVAPNYLQGSTLPTATLDLLATQTVTLQAVVDAAGGATPAGTSTPTITASQDGCIPGQIIWVYPQAGQEVSATVELKGTVNIPNLGFYKYEYSKPGDEIWNTIAAGNQAKVEGSIGFWNTSQLPQGDYLLRLVVADSQNTPFPACVIPVRVVQP
jgi:hypothetical protein